MARALTAAIALGLAPALALAAGGSPEPLDAWPQWRGPLGTGVAPHGDPPMVWSEDENVRWKIEIPGSGHSTPIVWGDRIFLSTAVPFGDAVTHSGRHADGAHDNLEPTRRMKFVALAVDRRDGSVVWQRTLAEERPHEAAHVTGGWASNSAVTDGELVFFYFGSRGLYALDLDGETVWRKDLGDMHTRHAHGEGSSPALYGDTLVVNWDHQGDSFLIAFDKRTGKERWKTARDEITSWSTPLVVEHGGKAQVVVSATGRVRGYDLANGEVIWECAGLSRNVVASPVAGGGMVYVANSYDWQAMMAIRLDAARGDVTETEAVAWKRHRDTPYVPSPLLYRDMLFFLKHSQGFLTNVDAGTGEPHYGPVRLDGLRMIFASPVGAADRVYIVDRGGTALVVRRGPRFELLATNRLDDGFSASPAIVGGEIYLRGHRFLYCIADDSPATPAG